MIIIDLIIYIFNIIYKYFYYTTKKSLENNFYFFLILTAYKLY